MWNMTSGVGDVEFHGGYCDDRSNPSLEKRGGCYNKFRILRWDISCIVLSHYIDHVCRQRDWWYWGFINGSALWPCLGTTILVRGRDEDATGEIFQHEQLQYSLRGMWLQDGRDDEEDERKEGRKKKNRIRIRRGKVLDEEEGEEEEKEEEEKGEGEVEVGQKLPWCPSLYCMSRFGFNIKRRSRYWVE